MREGLVMLLTLIANIGRQGRRPIGEKFRVDLE